MVRRRVRRRALTMSVAGTALFMADQHLHPRNFATAFLLFGAVAALEKRSIALLWIVINGAVPSDHGCCTGPSISFFLAWPGKFFGAIRGLAIAGIPFRRAT